MIGQRGAGCVDDIMAGSSSCHQAIKTILARSCEAGGTLTRTIVHGATELIARMSFVI
jgi:hypothetical protein